MPDRRRRVDDDVGARHVAGDADPAATRPAARPRGRARAERLTTMMSRRAGTPERVDHRAGRAAGAEHGDPAPATSTPASAQRGDEAVAVGAVPDEPPSAVTTTVLTERSAAAAGSSSSTAAATSSLCGIVTDSPPSPSTRIASTRRGAAPGRDLERGVRPVEPGGGERGVVDRRRQAVARPASRSRRRRHASAPRRSAEAARRRGPRPLRRWPRAARRWRRTRGCRPRWPST